MPHQYDELTQLFSHLLHQLSCKEVGWDFIHEFLKNWQKRGNHYLLEVRNCVWYHEALLKVLKSLHEEHDLSRLLNLILDKAIELTGAERGFVIAEGYEVARSFSKEDIANSENLISHTISKQVLRTGKPVLTENARYDAQWMEQRSVQENQLVSILCVPIYMDNQIIGVIYLDNRIQRGCFKETELQLLTALAEQAAVAFHNAKLYEASLHQTRELQIDKGLLESKIQEQKIQLEEVVKKIQQPNGPYHCFTIRSRSPLMQKIFQTIEQIKDQSLPVMITGESGTGKEVIARAIHYTGVYQDLPFVSQNCAAIPSSLIENALFGHEKGAYTSANEMAPGIFEQANGGTVFLDEIGELDLNSQAVLLHILDQKENMVVRRIGGNKEIPVSFRLITATNKNLRKMVQEQKFREDLYYRIHVIEIKVPPLRQRKEDIRGLLKMFLAEKGPGKAVESGVLAALINFDWPGNIRELQNEIYRLCAISDQIIRLKDISPHILSKATFIQEALEIGSLKSAMKNFERVYILKAMEAHKNHRPSTAKSLGIYPQTLGRKLKRYGFSDWNKDDEPETKGKK